MSFDAQEAVAEARRNVLGGRGPGADTAETDRYQRERPTLGARPTPLERELVHLRTAALRSGRARGVDEVAIRNQVDRVREVWWPEPPERPRSVAVEHTPGTAVPHRPANPRLAALAAMAAITVASLLRLRTERRRNAEMKPAQVTGRSLGPGQDGGKPQRSQR